eukprot:11815809-Alexandrium_andersonii.AAC.1
MTIEAVASSQMGIHGLALVLQLSAFSHTDLLQLRRWRVEDKLNLLFEGLDTKVPTCVATRLLNMMSCREGGVEVPNLDQDPLAQGTLDAFERKGLVAAGRQDRELTTWQLTKQGKASLKAGLRLADPLDVVQCRDVGAADVT